MAYVQPVNLEEHKIKIRDEVVETSRRRRRGEVDEERRRGREEDEEERSRRKVESSGDSRVQWGPKQKFIGRAPHRPTPPHNRISLWAFVILINNQQIVASIVLFYFTSYKYYLHKH